MDGGTTEYAVDPSNSQSHKSRLSKCGAGCADERSKLSTCEVVRTGKLGTWLTVAPRTVSAA